MSTTPPPDESGSYVAPPSTTTPPPPPHHASARGPDEIKLISHSSLFYWWPVWFLAFFMAMWTFVENKRLAIIPPRGVVTEIGSGEYTMDFGDGATTKTLQDAVRAKGSDEAAFGTRVSEKPWLGALFVIGLILTILITNIPLRGLWSFLIIILVVVIALVISLAGAWDTIFTQVGDLHIYINMAGYLFIGTAVFVVWAVATFGFDRRSYIIFAPGQIRVCEHIGDAVQTYSTYGVAMEKQRDDLFRHYILGFGSGDLIVRVRVGNGQQEIKLPNVLFIGWRLHDVEKMLARLGSSV